MAILHFVDIESGELKERHCLAWESAYKYAIDFTDQPFCIEEASPSYPVKFTYFNAKGEKTT